MANGESDNEPLAVFKYFADWWAYLRGPGTFLASQRLGAAETFTRSTKILAAGIAAVVALAAVNLKFSPYVTDEHARELITGKTTGIAMVLGCVCYAAIVHGVALLLKGSGNWRQTYVSFAFTLGFLWPVSALVLILNALFVRLMTGLPWTALPPFDVSSGGALERTAGNILTVAVCATVLLWLVGFLLYCYGCAVWIAHRLSVARIVVALVVALIAVNLKPVPIVLYWIAEHFEPVLSWILQRA